MTTEAAGETPERATTSQSESGQQKSEEAKVAQARPNWAYLVHLGALLLLLVIAIGTTCEISSRNEDYARLLRHHKWHLTCLQQTASDPGCPKNEVPDVPNQTQSADNVRASEKAGGAEQAKGDVTKVGGSEAIQGQNQPKGPSQK